jgi:hypothetical protein
MKHVTPVLKDSKHRQILIICFCIFTLSSCYKFEPLPDRIKSTYEFAVPIIDTTVSIEEFASVRYYMKYYSDYMDKFEIPEGTPIRMGEECYPFYIGDYAPSQEVEWLEPQLIIDSKDFPAGTTVNIMIYTNNDYDIKTFFWLPENYSITLSGSPVRIPETPKRIEDVQLFRSARRVCLDIIITYPSAMTGTEIANNRINIKLGIKYAIKTDLSIKL